MTSFWTDERVERLEELWERPLSTQEIADMLGTTKGAVCGKGWRLDLGPRPKIMYVRRRRPKPKRGPERPLRPTKLAVVRTNDYSWHISEMRKRSDAASLTPPAGVPSWRTFTRAVSADPALRAALERARAACRAEGVRRTSKRSKDFSWHLEQERTVGEVRGVKPPAGVVTWRTFRSAVAADPHLKAQVEAAREIRKASGWVPAMLRKAA